MKLLEFSLDGSHITVHRNLLGKETVTVAGQVQSQKRTIFGTTHKLKIGSQDYTLRYTVRDVWTRWIGRMIFELRANDQIISEYPITNSMFKVLQFFLSLLVFFVLYTITRVLIESACHGFVQHVY